MRTLILLPTYNEKENLEKLCSEILKVCAADILIIDDNSPDGTGRIADEICAYNPLRAHVIHRKGKLGLGSAIMAGFEYAVAKNYDIVINMDSDLSHDPKELPQILQAAENSDLVIASRHAKGAKIIGWDWKRHLLHKVAHLYTRLLLGNFTSDFTNSYKAYSVEILKKMPLKELLKRSSGFVWHTLLIYCIHRAGYRIKEVPTTFVYRTGGKSKMGHKEMISGLLAIFRYRFFG